MKFADARGVQVDPPFEVVRMGPVSPVAKQTLTVGQLIA